MSQAVLPQILESINFWDYLLADPAETLDQMQQYIIGIASVYPSINLHNALLKYINLWKPTATNLLYQKYVENLHDRLQIIFEESHFKYSCAGRVVFVEALEHDAKSKNPFYNHSFISLESNQLFKLLRSFWYFCVTGEQSNDENFNNFSRFNQVENDELIKNDEYLNDWNNGKYKDLYYKQITVPVAANNPHGFNGILDRMQIVQFGIEYCDIAENENVMETLTEFVICNDFWIHNNNFQKVLPKDDDSTDDEEEQINLKDSESFKKGTGVNKQEIRKYVVDILDKALMEQYGNTLKKQCNNKILVTRGLFSATTSGNDYLVSETSDALCIWWLGHHYTVAVTFWYFGH